MDYGNDLAPEVSSILRSARDRAGATDRVSVEAASLGAAFERTEAAGNVPIIAEVKPTSPTTDGERADDPVSLARQMVAGGAAAISVLTEPDHFGGSPDSLRAVRDAVDVPVLRKDFILEEAQLDTVEADVVLLIVRFVDELEPLLDAARERGFQVLVEVHSTDELETALDAGADVIGVNNRNLTTLEVDLSTFEQVAPAVPDDVTLVAESGISTPDDVRRMRAAGADGLLVGTAIMAGDVSENTNRLTDIATKGEAE